MKLIAALASISSREKSLKSVVNSLLPQVDYLCVYLNGYNKVPSYLKNSKIIIEQSQNYGDLGDAGKFWWSDKVSGYYFSCDDDIIYPDNYIQFMLEKLNGFDDQAVVGLHGVYLVQKNFESYYKSRVVFHNQNDLSYDIYVHILGSGALCFSTKVFQITPKEFKHKNMADIWVGCFGQKTKIPFICIEHKGDYLTLIDPENEDTIWYQSEIKQDNNVMNTGDRQTEAILNNNPWKIHQLKGTYKCEKPVYVSEQPLLQALALNKEVKANIRYNLQSYCIRGLTNEDHIFQLLHTTKTFYELDLLEEIKRRDLKGIYVDIGANIGNHTIFFSNHCPSTRVYSIEASPDIYKVLSRNCNENSLDTSVKLLNIAISKQLGTLYVSEIDPHNVGMTKVVETPTNKKVQSSTIDRCFSEEKGRIVVLKIDIEGGEIDAICGGLKIIKHHRPLIIAECHSEKDFDNVSKLLREIGYFSHKIDYGHSPTYIWEFLE
jgi:FkbM family methyltransferase